MTVTSVDPTYSGSLSGTGTIDGVRNYVRMFTVITDTPDDGVITVGNHQDIPSRNTYYAWKNESDTGALCYSVQVERDTNVETVWHVTCLFSSDIGGPTGGFVRGDPARDVDNPLNKPVEVTWGSWSETQVVTEDIHGNTILNGCGLPFNPPLTKLYRGRSVTVERNEAVYPVALSQNYEDSVNSDPFYGYTVGQARLDNCTAVRRYDHDMSYFQVRYDIRFRKPDWKQRFPNVSTRYFKRDATTGQIITNADGTKKLFCTEDDGVANTNVVFLDVGGTRMSQDDVLAGNAIIYAVEIYTPKPYSALQL